jgi:hypothetical protein
VDESSPMHSLSHEKGIFSGFLSGCRQLGSNVDLEGSGRLSGDRGVLEAAADPVDHSYVLEDSPVVIAAPACSLSTVTLRRLT